MTFAEIYYGHRSTGVWSGQGKVKMCIIEIYLQYIFFIGKQPHIKQDLFTFYLFFYFGKQKKVTGKGGSLVVRPD